MDAQEFKELIEQVGYETGPQFMPLENVLSFRVASGTELGAVARIVSSCAESDRDDVVGKFMDAKFTYERHSGAVIYFPRIPYIPEADALPVEKTK